jgi:hypothetical protein
LIISDRFGSVARESSSDGATFIYLTLGNPSDPRFRSIVNLSVGYWGKIPHNRLARIAMIAMTTRSSIKVNP